MAVFAVGLILDVLLGIALAMTLIIIEIIIALKALLTLVSSLACSTTRRARAGADYQQNYNKESYEHIK